MLFNTLLLGPIEIDEAHTLEFPAGIPAFEDCTRFQLFHDADSDEPRVFWLQSLDRPDLLFSLTDPALLGLRYELELSDAEVASLRLADPADAVVLLMVYRDGEAGDGQHPALAHLRANLLGPLVLNLREKRGLQKTGLQCDILVHNRPER